MTTTENKIGGKMMFKPRWKNDKYWRVDFENKSKSFSVKEYKTKEAAEEAAYTWRREYAKENGKCLLKNKYRDMGDHYEVEVIGRGDTRIGKISKQDLPIFEALAWYAFKPKRSNRWYMGTYMCTGKFVRFHRFIKPWGKNPEWKMVDHINRNGLHNLRSNLRDGGNGKNERNQKMHKTNTSGFNGIVLEKKKNGDPIRWRARWPENGKKEIRSFQVNKHGFDEAKQMAIAARREADERLGIRNGYASE